MIFNDLLEYSASASNQHPKAPGELLTGLSKTISANDFDGVANHIKTSTPGLPYPDRHIGFGKYKLTVEEWGHVFIDFSDSDYGNYPTELNLSNDIILIYEENKLFWRSGKTLQRYKLSNGDTINIWDQRAVGDSVKAQNKNGFKILASTTLPLDGTDAVVTHFEPGELFVNLEVQGDIIVS